MSARKATGLVRPKIWSDQAEEGMVNENKSHIPPPRRLFAHVHENFSSFRLMLHSNFIFLHHSISISSCWLQGRA